MNAKQISTMIGRLVEHQSIFAGLSTESAQQVIQNPKDAISFLVEQLEKRGVMEDRIKSTGIVGNDFLHCISNGKSLIIPACDGQQLEKRGVMEDRIKSTGIVGNDFLHCISNGKSLIIPACDGQRIIAEAKDVFTMYIDEDFRNWKADGRGVATQEASASVFEMKRDGTFAQMFDIDVSNLTDANSTDVKRFRQMVYSQDQIISFVEKHRGWLRTDGRATLFPFESYGNFFVASVFCYSGGLLEVGVDRFGDDGVWGAGCRGCVVVPRLA